MSDVLLPDDLPGLTWDTLKSPEFSTEVAASHAFQEARWSHSPYPIWHFRHSYSVLDADPAVAELQALVGFFCARRGRWDSWLFADPNDSTATLEPFGTGDGTTTAFQLCRAFGPFVEPCKNVAAGPSIYKAGALQASGYTIDADGLVTFSSAPGSGQALTWSGTYYYRCRFEQDAMEANEFMQRLFELREMRFVGSLGKLIR